MYFFQIQPNLTACTNLPKKAIITNDTPPSKQNVKNVIGPCHLNDGIFLNVNISHVALAKWNPTARTFSMPDLQVPLDTRAAKQMKALCDDDLQP
jgi:hypothetical protein